MSKQTDKQHISLTEQNFLSQTQDYLRKVIEEDKVYYIEQPFGLVALFAKRRLKFPDRPDPVYHNNINLKNLIDILGASQPKLQVVSEPIPVSKYTTDSKSASTTINIEIPYSVYDHIISAPSFWHEPLLESLQRLRRVPDLGKKVGNRWPGVRCFRKPGFKIWYRFLSQDRLILIEKVIFHKKYDIWN